MNKEAEAMFKALNGNTRHKKKKKATASPTAPPTTKEQAKRAKIMAEFGNLRKKALASSNRSTMNKLKKKAFADGQSMQKDSKEIAKSMQKAGKRMEEKEAKEKTRHRQDTDGKSKERHKAKRQKVNQSKQSASRDNSVRRRESAAKASSHRSRSDNRHSIAVFITIKVVIT